VAIPELRDGLYRWTAQHPEWKPGAAPDTPADWPRLVGSVAYDAGDSVVFVDPLVPEELWPQLDELVRGRRVHVLTTLRWHRRSRDAVLARYDADRKAPPQVELVKIPRAGETMVWLPEHRALVPGDRLLGADGGGLRLCPPSWLRYLESGIDEEELRQALRRLLDLPVELVLVSHGEPVLANGRAGIERALRAA
jgi:hypothetical protein